MGILKGKKALIFGVATDKSIAYGIAKQFKAEGAEIGLSYANERLERMVKPIADELGAIFFEECDLGSDEKIKELAEKWEKAHGKVDIIVHAVAFAGKEALSGRYLDTKREDFKMALDISAFTLVAVTKGFEHLMTETASVVTLSYYGAEKVVPNYNVMGVAKAALEASVRYLAVDLGKSGRRINAISAGPVKTLSAMGVAGFKSMLAGYGERAPMGRNIDIEDCGDLAAFLCSDKAKNITGETIYVDAGYHIMGF